LGHGSSALLFGFGRFQRGRAASWALAPPGRVVLRVTFRRAADRPAELAKSRLAGRLPGRVALRVTFRNGLRLNFYHFRAIWRDAYELYASRTPALPWRVAVRVTCRRAADRAADFAKCPSVQGFARVKDNTAGLVKFRCITRHDAFRERALRTEPILLNQIGRGIASPDILTIVH
jgi:hypothetical protein